MKLSVKQQLEQQGFSAEFDRSFKHLPHFDESMSMVYCRQTLQEKLAGHGLDEKTIYNFLDGTAYTGLRKITVLSLAAGTVLKRFDKHAKSAGEKASENEQFYTLTTIDGVSSLGLGKHYLNQYGSICERDENTFVVIKPSKFIVTTACSFDDHFSIPGQVQKTKGGAPQLFLLDGHENLICINNTPLKTALTNRNNHFLRSLSSLRGFAATKVYLDTMNSSNLSAQLDENTLFSLTGMASFENYLPMLLQIHNEALWFFLSVTAIHSTQNTAQQSSSSSRPTFFSDSKHHPSSAALEKSIPDFEFDWTLLETVEGYTDAVAGGHQWIDKYVDELKACYSGFANVLKKRLHEELQAKSGLTDSINEIHDAVTRAGKALDTTHWRSNSKIEIEKSNLWLRSNRELLEKEIKKHCRKTELALLRALFTFYHTSDATCLKALSGNIPYIDREDKVTIANAIRSNNFVELVNNSNSDSETLSRMKDEMLKFLSTDQWISLKAILQFVLDNAPLPDAIEILYFVYQQTKPYKRTQSKPVNFDDTPKPSSTVPNSTCLPEMKVANIMINVNMATKIKEALLACCEEKHDKSICLSLKSSPLLQDNHEYKRLMTLYATNLLHDRFYLTKQWLSDLLNDQQLSEMSYESVQSILLGFVARSKDHVNDRKKHTIAYFEKDPKRNWRTPGDTAEDRARSSLQRIDEVQGDMQKYLREPYLRTNDQVNDDEREKALNDLHENILASIQAAVDTYCDSVAACIPTLMTTVVTAHMQQQTNNEVTAHQTATYAPGAF